MRYIGSRCKRCRAVGASVCGRIKCAIARKPNPPGQHGGDRKKRSEYATHLIEKQKIRWTYDVSEKQFFNAFSEAAASKGVTGTVLLQILESRLDNILFRSGLVASRPQARQLISHGHVMVDGKKASIASMRLKPGQVVSFKEKSQPIAKTMQAGLVSVCPEWISTDPKAMTAKILMRPEREQLDQSFQESLVIEFYSR
ncbi:MAG: 30S ribosomal protein S4 [Candidatus Melainabacteria bacterium]|nr:30S ribosomal protein S4 [Candidatus Melainabacteria bacterium]